MSWEKYLPTNNRLRTTAGPVFISLSGISVTVIQTADMIVQNKTGTPLDPWIGFRGKLNLSRLESTYALQFIVYSSADSGATWLPIWLTGSQEATHREVVVFNFFRPYVYSAMSGTSVVPPNGPKVPPFGSSLLRMKIDVNVSDSAAGGIGNPITPGALNVNSELEFAYSILTR